MQFHCILRGLRFVKLAQQRGSALLVLALPVASSFSQGLLGFCCCAEVGFSAGLGT